MAIVKETLKPQRGNKKMTKSKNGALAKAQKSRKIQKELMLVPGKLTAPQLLKILQKTPKEHIYTRPGKGGGNWEYVTGTYVKKILNYVFGWNWDFEILNESVQANQVIVKGKLTVRDKKNNPIIKEQYGRADVKVKKGTKIPLDLGNDYKAATTDALKKCASELGIASDIYGKNEFKEVQLVDKKFQPPQNGNGSSVDKMPAGKKERQTIENYCKELGYSDPERAYSFIKKLTGISFNENLTKTESSKIIGTLLIKLNKKNGK